MNGENARPGLAYIMRELDATRWHEDPEGYVISVKILGRRRCRNYLIRPNDLTGIEQALENDTIPLRVRAEDYTRLADSDYR